MRSSPVIWVLLDNRAGNNNQSIGLAEALGVDFITKQICYNSLAKLPNFLRSTSFLAIDKASKEAIYAPYPDLIIAAGRKLAPVARYIKKKSAGKTKLVQIMWPESAISYFDLIAVPKHDNKKPAKNIVEIIGAINRINEDILDKHRAKWAMKFVDLPSPKITLLIGGNTKKGDFTIKHAEDLIQKTNKLAAKLGGCVLATNSRRTSKKVSEFIKNNLTCEQHFHDIESDKENPYFGYLAVADHIIASGDSISMCSEACSTGKAVYIYSTADTTPKKHQKFHKTLYNSNAATELGKAQIVSNYKPLNEAARLANIVKDKLL